MPIAIVTLNDSFDQWRQKTNAMIGFVNSLSAAGDIISVTAPSSGQVLVYNGTSFVNVSVHGDITIDSTGAVVVTGGGNALTKGRLRFAGSITGLY